MSLRQALLPEKKKENEEKVEKNVSPWVTTSLTIGTLSLGYSLLKTYEPGLYPECLQGFNASSAGLQAKVNFASSFNNLAIGTLGSIFVDSIGLTAALNRAYECGKVLFTRDGLGKLATSAALTTVSTVLVEAVFQPMTQQGLQNFAYRTGYHLTNSTFTACDAYQPIPKEVFDNGLQTGVKVAVVALTTLYGMYRQRKQQQVAVEAQNQVAPPPSTPTLGSQNA